MAKISDSDKKELLSYGVMDLTFTKLVSLFGSVQKNKGTAKENGYTTLQKTTPRFEPSDTFEISHDEYELVKTKHITTVGKFIYNKYVIEGSGVGVATGYVDWELTSSGNSKLEAVLTKALLDDVITRDQFDKYIHRRDTLGQQLHAVVCSSFTETILECPPEVLKRRKELVEENKEAFENGDVFAAVKVEKELLNIAKETLKDDPAMDLYTSEARGSFGNNFKNNHVIKGPVFNNITGKFDIVTTSYMEGFNKESLPSLANVVIAGSYPSAVGTQTAGYLTKQLIAALQTEVIGEPGSDCGTKRTIKYTIGEKEADEFRYRYIVDNGKLVELSSENLPKYIGKEVNLRSPMCCIGNQICNICAGNLFNILGIKNGGLTSTTASSTILQAKLSAKHDGTAKVTMLDPDRLLI